MQLATTLILYTGANTSFNGFPFLTSYVAGDSFLPRWLLKRGHRLVFSNAIILLTVTALALLIIKDADVNSLVPLYAIGVFTAFSMAGFGMAKYHHTRRAPGWRSKFIINFSAGVLTLVVVIIFAVVKFTEGAWVVVVLFAILVPALIRLNAEYRAEAEVLETVIGEQPPPPPHYSRRVVFVLVDSFDLATLAALRYARSLRPTQIRAVHFVIDSVRAEKLRDKWTRADRGVALDFIDCPDRRLTKAATDLVEREVADAGTHVTVILPRRSSRRCSAGCCTTARRTRSPPRSAACRGRPPRSSPMTCQAGWRCSRPVRRRPRRARPASGEGRGSRPPSRGGAAARQVDRARTGHCGRGGGGAQELAREADVAAAHSAARKQDGRAWPGRDRRRQRRQGGGGGQGPGRRSARSSGTRCSPWRSTTRPVTSPRCSTAGRASPV